MTSLFEPAQEDFNDDSKQTGSPCPSSSMPAPGKLALNGLDTCIHCGMCLPACPTYLATGSEAESPRGRLYLMKQLLEGNLAASEVKPHLDQCLACHGCETACPSGVEYGRLLMETREALAPNDHSIVRHLKRFIFRWVLPQPAILIGGGSLLLLYQRSGLQTLIRQSRILKLFPKLAAQEALMPSVPDRRPIQAGDVFGDPAGEPVSLLVGCIMDVFYNPVHWDTIRVLVANGYRVHIPERTCCGALAHHAGETDITRRLAKQTMEALLAPNPSWIVLNSAGCGSSIKDYPHILAPTLIETDETRTSAETAAAKTEIEAIEDFAAKVVDVTELLAKKPLSPFKHPVSATVAYHAACHLYHVQKVQKQPIDLLSQIDGLKLVPLDNAEACCGSAGIYNIEHPELSSEILDAKMESIRTACATGGVDTLVTGNPGCLLQLESGVRKSGLKVRVRHPISVLAEAYGD